MSQDFKTTNLFNPNVVHIYFQVLIYLKQFQNVHVTPRYYPLSSSQLMFEGWTGLTWVLGLGQSLLNYVGVVLILLALRHVTPTQNKVIRSFQVVASYTLQVELLAWHRRLRFTASNEPFHKLLGPSPG